MDICKEDSTDDQRSPILIDENSDLKNEDSHENNTSELRGNSINNCNFLERSTSVGSDYQEENISDNKSSETLEEILHCEENNLCDVQNGSDVSSTDNTMHDDNVVIRPFDLSLPRPLQNIEKDLSASSFEDLESPSVSLERLESVIQAVTEVPLSEQGMIIKDGHMMSFVAEDLNEMIRMSSPLSRSSRTNSIRSISSVNSISSSSYGSTSVSGMSRSSSLPLNPSPDEIPLIDPHALKDIETHAKRVADNLDLIMGNLNTSLHKMSAITLSCGNAYGVCVDNTCENVDICIKSMYTLMAKCEEASKVMQPIYKINEQIKEIKRLLDLFESQMSKDKDEKTTKAKK